MVALCCAFGGGRLCAKFVIGRDCERGCDEFDSDSREFATRDYAALGIKVYDGGLFL